MLTLISNHLNDIQTLCRAHRVKAMYAFGSVLTNEFNAKSDVDLIVDFNPMDVTDYADNYYGLKFALESIFKTKVDLLENQALKNPYFKKEIDEKKHLIYG